MFINVDLLGKLTLEEADNFRKFHVTAPAAFSAADVAAHLGDLAQLDADGKHLWVSVAEVSARFAAAQNPQWQADFDKMIASVAKYGFLSANGQDVRAHIETV